MKFLSLFACLFSLNAFAAGLSPEVRYHLGYGYNEISREHAMKSALSAKLPLVFGLEIKDKIGSESIFKDWGIESHLYRNEARIVHKIKELKIEAGANHTWMPKTKKLGVTWVGELEYQIW